MMPAEVIKQKRNGLELSSDQIKNFVDGYVSGEIADYQMSALLMAIFFKGMKKKEVWALTESMLRSGVVLDLSHIPGMKIDKHSTGGVGDKTSLIVGPIAASVGVKVPMISGRGLGHTGGTVDKLESIPGFNTQLSLIQFQKQILELGLCFIGQTAEICPADKKMYALRDVTATVECIPLICASIMSKKLAEGIDGLVLDVKYGSGAFMKTSAQAEALAHGLMEIARASGKKVHGLITNMDQILGNAVGNALEVQECIEVLNNRGPADLKELSLVLAAHMIFLGKKAKNIKEAFKFAENALSSGRALECFERVVKAQGGNLKGLPRAKATFEVISPKSGRLAAVDVEKIGLASLSLGAGRLKTDDKIEMSAGLIFYKKISDPIKKGEIVATLHHDGTRDVHASKKMILDSCEIRLQKCSAPRLIKEVLNS